MGKDKFNVRDIDELRKVKTEAEQLAEALTLDEQGCLVETHPDEDRVAQAYGLTYEAYDDLTDYFNAVGVAAHNSSDSLSEAFRKVEELIPPGTKMRAFFDMSNYVHMCKAASLSANPMMEFARAMQQASRSL